MLQRHQLSDHLLGITGMNTKANFGVHTLRYAGLFNLPIPIHCVFGIGVSLLNL